MGYEAIKLSFCHQISGWFATFELPTVTLSFQPRMPIVSCSALARPWAPTWHTASAHASKCGLRAKSALFGAGKNELRHAAQIR
jgi:hypothetical protein